MRDGYYSRGGHYTDPDDHLFGDEDRDDDGNVTAEARQDLAVRRMSPSDREQYWAGEVYRQRLSVIKDRYAHDRIVAVDAAAREAAGQKFDRALARADQRYEQATQEAAQRRSMSKHTDAFKAAQAALTAAAADLKALDAKAESGEITERFAQTERARLHIAVRVAEGKAGDAGTAYRDEALKEARALRAAAAVGDSASVTADELLRARLMADPRDGEAFMVEAQAMLEAGQPGRAAILAEVGAAKGARTTGDLGSAINEALDASVPDRKAAREIEQAVEADMTAFGVSRSQALAESLGTDAQGNVGNGSVSERTSASVAAKVGAFVASAGK